ncbi:MAG: AMP-binding protein, partial [Algicola sp.]|nr:AMP-binding protein [Algicola sp.]
QIYNHYGPTEAVVGCAMFDVTGNLADLAQGDGQIPIGKAMANTELFVLDHNAQPVPLGVVGELYVGGECVTKGYINRAALSFEKFVELTLPGAVYQRFYRTGDQVKYDAQGNLWFVGRVDNQVKLRGFRIELGEIEQQINEVAGVEKALVQVTGEGAQKQLLAFIRANAGGPLSPLLLANVHAQLDKYLPAYMKPDHFVALDDVPLSANGKADYKALVASFVAPQQTPVLPVTSTEKKLRSLWAEVLQRDEQSLSVQDSFFSVGGHSLLIIKLFSQIRQHWGEVISVNQLYQYPTIAAQAGYLVIADTLAEAGQLVTLREGNNNGLFIIHPIGGDVSCYGSLTQQLDTDMTVYGLQHAAFVKGQNVELTTIEIMAESYLQQIKSAQANGPYHLLGWSFGGLVALFVARLLESQGETVSYLGLIDSVVQQDQQGWASFEQSYQQENGHGEPSIESYHDFVQSQPQLLADFDRAYQVEALAMQMNGSQSTIRQVVISNLVVAKAINTDFNTNKLHYYGAAQTQSQSGPDNLVTLGQISDVPMTVHTVSADHFTIMQYPQVNLLAQYIDADLLLTSSASEISKTRGTNGK